MVSNIGGFAQNTLYTAAQIQQNFNNPNQLLTPMQQQQVNQPAAQTSPMADLMAIVALLGVMAKSNFNASQAMAAKSVNPSQAPASSNAAPSASTSGRLKIAQIDNFSTDNSGFNHGEEVAKTLRSGGNNGELAGKVDLMQFDVSGGNPTAKTAQALQSIVQQVRNGEQVDAVNISLQDFEASGNSAQVQSLISELKSLGVPVAVAAGNGGRGTTNQLGSNNAFVVESTTNGAVNNSSGQGNIRAEGRTTSFATANLTPLLAAQKASGLSVDQIKSML